MLVPVLLVLTFLAIFALAEFYLLVAPWIWRNLTWPRIVRRSWPQSLPAGRPTTASRMKDPLLDVDAPFPWKETGSTTAETQALSPRLGHLSEADFTHVERCSECAGTAAASVEWFKTHVLGALGSHQCSTSAKPASKPFAQAPEAAASRSSESSDRSRGPAGG